MKKLTLQRPNLTQKQNKQLKAALLTVLADAFLCVVYVIMLALFMTDSNIRFFIVFSVAFYMIVAVILILSVCFIRKLTKQPTTAQDEKISETEVRSDD